ncbi:MAG: pyridoxal phosphate-dependent aminotransferase [Myxococcota bacterium]|jgi:DNA-binding transcriptional MocR family regulator|nr:pyridoxal phosphate-dependent aminotransferase [Myxococcota bacterium]
MAKTIPASQLRLHPVSVTRQMAAAFPRLKAMAEAKGLRLHHLGAGYPHPEVSDPTTYIAQKNAYFRHLAQKGDPSHSEDALRALLMPLYGYTDTIGPASARQAFATVYGHDFGFSMNPDLLVPTVGATGGISLLCSLYERSGEKIAYLVDAPTYTGFVSRAGLSSDAAFYSVDLDEEGPDPVALRAQIRKARQDGRKVAFYYTVPDGHNPGGISFSDARRQAVMKVMQEEETFVVEDAPYTYISYEKASSRPKPFIAMDPTHAVHLFTASKIGLPGPRVAFLYTEIEMTIDAGQKVPLRTLVVTEASGDTLFCNPEALRSFEAYLHDENLELRKSLWPVAQAKNAIYGENRAIVLGGLDEGLAGASDQFGWTKPGAGFFSVFTFKKRQVRTTPEFVEKLISEYGVVTIPMFGFYPDDARKRDPEAGLNQLRLSFCFSEHIGEGRRDDMREAVQAFTAAVRVECGL